ncbi:MAG: hypothetical protein AAF351_06375 [Pseudomonadota bacterium]
MKHSYLAFLLTAMVAHSAAAETSDNPPALSIPLTTPAEVPASSPRLEAGPTGDVTLSWLAPTADGHTALKYSRFSDGGWSPAATVTTEPDMFVNWADLPSVVSMGDGKLAAHWLKPSGGDWYAYDVIFMQSNDNGETWSVPIHPHRDGTKTEHGFVSMYPAVGATGLIWLDGRKTATRDGNDPYQHGMTLRSAAINPGSKIGDEQVVDELICDCCSTDVAVAASGPIVVYRDRTRDEVRDISVARMIDRQWQPSTPIHRDGWVIDGCPVNGPSIIAEGDHVAVAWFTAATVPRVQLTISHDSGEHFSTPIEIARDNTMGRVGLAKLDDGYVVSWLSRRHDGLEILIRAVTSEGEIGPVRAVTGLAKSLSAMSVPQMARYGDLLVFAWTEKDDAGTRIASARIDIADL